MNIQHSENIAWRIIDGQAYIVTVNDSKLHLLNEIGTRIWQLIERKIDFENLVKKLLSEYDVESEKLRADLKEFIEELKTKGLIKIEDNK